ncbi:MAG: YidC/Oxa1 family membrane protein insertase [Chloroflexaceae bacterium]|nr:YidC/Oxa1 family membrane protein insertase [Chloroflexaceae bacterium]
MWEIWLLFVGFLEQLLAWFGTMTGSIGIGIILFTILARLTILPLTLKSIRSSRRMQELQPKMKELQRKYGKDKEKLNQEMMVMWKEHGVNPAGGCLPMFLQLPIFFGVYQAVFHLMVAEQRVNIASNALRAAVLDQDISQLLNQPFPLGPMWHLTGIEASDSIIRVLEQPFLGLNLGVSPFGAHTEVFPGAQYLIIPTVTVIFQFIQQLMAMPRVQDPQQKMMSQMMMIFPLFFGFIAFTFPQGAVLYWLTSSTIGIIQQYFISGWGSLANYLKFLPADRLPSSPLALATAAAGVGGSASMASSSGSDTGDASPIATRPTFWGVLSPLVDSGDTAHAGSTDSTPKEREESAAHGDSNGEADPEQKIQQNEQNKSGDASEQAIADARRRIRQARRPRR